MIVLPVAARPDRDQVLGFVAGVLAVAGPCLVLARQWLHVPQAPAIHPKQRSGHAVMGAGNVAARAVVNGQQVAAD